MEQQLLNKICPICNRGPCLLVWKHIKIAHPKHCRKCLKIIVSKNEEESSVPDDEQLYNCCECEPMARLVHELLLHANGHDGDSSDSSSSSEESDNYDDVNDDEDDYFAV